MSQKKQTMAKQQSEHEIRCGVVIYKKKVVDTPLVAECKPSSQGVAGMPGKAWDAHLHSHCLIPNVPVVANDTRRKEVQ